MTKQQQRGIQTVELSGDILRLVCGAKHPLSLSEIAEYMQMAPGSAYKYLMSLLRTGLLKRNESTLEFEAGPLSLRLGLSKIHHDPLLQQVRKALTAFATEHEVNVFAAMWSDLNGPTVVFYKEFAGFFNIGFRLGIQLSLTSTTTGRLFLAYQTPKVCIEKLKPDFFSATEILAFEDQHLIGELEEIQQQGYSSLVALPTPGFSSYAVPILNEKGEIILSMTAFAKTDSLTQEKIQRIVQHLQHIAQNVREIHYG